MTKTKQTEAATATPKAFEIKWPEQLVKKSMCEVQIGENFKVLVFEEEEIRRGMPGGFHPAFGMIPGEPATMVKHYVGKLETMDGSPVPKVLPHTLSERFWKLHELRAWIERRRDDVATFVKPA